MFPRLFDAANARGIPVWNLLCSGALMTAIVVATASVSLTDQFNEIINMAVILTLLPYLYTAGRYLAIPRNPHLLESNKQLVTTVTVVACGYCLWALAGSEANLTQTAMIFLCLSIPLYAAFARNVLPR
jgi:arginine:agmatine antiporter